MTIINTFLSRCEVFYRGILFFPRATSEGFLLCTSSAGEGMFVPAALPVGCRWVAGGLPVGIRTIENLNLPKENRGF